MHSVEQPFRNLHKFCIFLARGGYCLNWPCIPFVQQENQFRQFVRKFDKKRYSAQIALKIEFLHVGRV